MYAWECVDKIRLDAKKSTVIFVRTCGYTIDNNVMWIVFIL